jgi:hypothetical protein
VFTASTPDQTVFGEPDLATLLRLIFDVCVWHRNRVVAVVHDGQRVSWLAPEYRAGADAA